MSKLSVIAEPGKQEIVLIRIFDAPRELVFRTYTDPSTIGEWWGPRSMTTAVDLMEVKKGGVWRFVQQESNGTIHAHNGVYHEVTAPERLVNTYEYEGFPGSVGLVTTTFEELPDGKTKFTEVSLYPSAEVREGVLQSGMTEGAEELFDRLEAFMAKKLQSK
jgi:uncharacterized protein YndB with AHSA1/START domain